MALGLALSFTKVHKYGNEGSLSVGGHKSYDLILNALNTAVYLLFKTMLGNRVHLAVCVRNSRNRKLLYNAFSDFFTAYVNKWRKVSKAYRLTAILIGCNLGDDLCRDVAGG